tara:strand:+ start:57 stop:320 length:264 start_codon:yes stop_codon:yes gene_type:complete
MEKKNLLPEDIIATNDKIADAKELLRQNGYYIHNLYHIDDVTRMYECTDSEAMEIIELAIDNDGTANQIWENMRYFAEDMGLKEKED